MTTPAGPIPRLTFLGAAGAVTGSCTLVRAGATTILVDCGAAQGAAEPELPGDLESVEAVIMTHGHLDHVGRIPALFERGFQGTLVGHPATCELARILWHDTLHMQAERGRKSYSSAAVRVAEKRFTRVAYGARVTVGDIAVSLHDAGHILGSSHALLEHGNTRVLFSGDIGIVRTPILRDPCTAWEQPVDAVVIESTYGNRRHKDRTATVAELKQIVHETIGRRGVLLIPAFAIGRTQEVLYHFNDMVESSKIPALPVVVDSPMGNRVTELYRAHEDCYDGPTRARILAGDLPLEFPGLGTAISGEQSRTIAELRPPYVVVAGSGMCTGGRILRHLKRCLPSPATTVALVGYQAHGSLGRRLVDGAEEVSIDGERIPVRARIATLGGLSAHADREGLLAWARAIPGTPRFFVNHGEPEAVGALVSALKLHGLAAWAVSRGEEASTG